MPWQGISRGEQVPVKRAGMRRNVANQLRILRGSQELVRGHQLGVLQVLRDIEHRFAFAYRESHLIDVPVGNLPKHIVSADGLIEEVFAGLQLPLWMLPHIQAERKRAPQYAVLLEQTTYGPARGAVRNGHKDAFSGKS